MNPERYARSVALHCPTCAGAESRLNAGSLKAQDVVWRVLAIAFFISIGTPTAHAAGPYSTARLMDRAERLQLAEKLEKGFASLQREIPTLSPSERAWLEQEEKESLDSNGKITRRYFELTGSREWALRELEVPVRTTVNALVAIRHANDSEHEMLHWLMVTSVLTDYSFWNAVNTLIEKKNADPKIAEFIGGSYQNHSLLFANATLRAREILSRVLIPTLNSQ